MKLSVLVVAICLELATSRRLNEQAETNDVDPDSPGFVEPREWVKITVSPVPLYNVGIGERVEFECEAIGSPAPVIQWLKGHKPLTENERYDTILDNSSRGLAKVRSRLVINNALPIHQGVFTCLAESLSKVATAQSKLRVTRKGEHDKNFTALLATKFLGAFHRPRITLWNTVLMDVLGGDVVLPCQTVGNPKPQITWLDSSDQPIENNDSRFSVLPDGALRIRSIVWSDMGMYTCISRNEVDEDRVQSFLYPLKED